MGEQGPPGPSSGGVTYVRWGRTTCPNTARTELVKHNHNVPCAVCYVGTCTCVAILMIPGTYCTI